MRTIIFLAFVVLCGLVLGWLIKRPGKHKGLAQQPGFWSNATNADPLATPPDYLLANRGELWRAKQRRLEDRDHLTHAPTPRTPLPDAYSRRDTHGVLVGTAQVRKAGPDEEISVTPIRPKKEEAAG